MDCNLQKFREYVMGSNLMHRLTAKYELIHKSLGQDGTQLPTSPRLTVGGAGGGGAGGATPLGNKPRRRRIGRTPLIGQPKLFAGSLEEYLEATNQEIPLIMKSCIRVINLYGNFTAARSEILWNSIPIPFQFHWNSIGIQLESQSHIISYIKLKWKRNWIH